MNTMRSLVKIGLPAVFLLLSSGNVSFADENVNAAVNPGMLQQHHSDIDRPNTIVVNGFGFSGNVSISSADLHRLLSSYVGQECDLGKLREASNRVTEEYHRRGLTLAKAFIPPQSIVGGIVRVMIVEGRIGKISIEGNKNYSSSFILSHLTGGGEGPGLSLNCLEKGLLHLNQDFTDLKVTANFVPGREPGTTDIHVKVDDSSPVHATIYGNNYGSDYVSRYRFGANIEWVNSLIPGGHLIVGGLIGDNPDHMKVFSGSYEFPVNSCGTMVGLSAFDGSFDVGKDFADLGIHDHEISGNIYIRQPLSRSRGSRLFGKFGFRAAEAKYYLLDAISSRDNTRAAYLELQGDKVFAGGRGLADLTISKGLGGMFGGTDPGDPYASRIDASNDFTKLNLDLARYQPVSDIFSALFRVSGQWSGDNLLAGEEWLIGGLNSVHGYSIGEGSGDKGYSASFSLRANPLKNRESLQLAAFIDYGYAYKHLISPGSNHTTELTGVGLGISSHLMTIAPTDLRFDIGFPLNPSSNFLNDNPVLYFEASIRL